MSFSSSPSRTRGHPLPPLHREVSSRPPLPGWVTSPTRTKEATDDPRASRAGPDTGPYEVIHLGGQAAVVVPVADFLRLRALERGASPQALEDAEDTAAMLEWKARDAAGQTTFVPADEARRRLGLPR